MKFLKCLICISFLLFFALFFSKCSVDIKNDKQPNILLILVDDLGWSDVGAYGSEINTPNIDRLAYEGIRFTQFHNTAICFASRACLLTGQYAQKVNMSKTNENYLENAVTLGEVLKEAGYLTLMVGKYHGLDNPYYRGFDRYFGLHDGCCNYFNPGYRREGEPEPAHKKGKLFPRDWAIDSIIYEPYTPEEKDFYTTDYFTNTALQYLDEYKSLNKPIFLYMAFTAPHDPLMAWPDDIEKYVGTYMDGYKSVRKKRYERQKQMGLIDSTFPLSKPDYNNWDSLSVRDKILRDSVMATYAAMIDRLDKNIGRVLTKLDDIGELENTIVFFMSDNGAQPKDDEEAIFPELKVSNNSLPIGSTGRWTSLTTSWANVANTPFRQYKSDSHEGGIASPLIIYGPKKLVPAGLVTAYPSHLIDIMPTIMELTNAEYPDSYNGDTVYPYDGLSLLPLANKNILKRDKPIFWQFGEGKAILKGKWKLVSDYNKDWELYDVSVDKTETNNLITEYPEIAKNLIEEWQEWQAAVSESDN